MKISGTPFSSHLHSILWFVIPLLVAGLTITPDVASGQTTCYAKATFGDVWRDASNWGGNPDGSGSCNDENGNGYPDTPDENAVISAENVGGDVKIELEVRSASPPNLEIGFLTIEDDPNSAAIASLEAVQAVSGTARQVLDVSDVDIDGANAELFLQDGGNIIELQVRGNFGNSGNFDPGSRGPVVISGPGSSQTLSGDLTGDNSFANLVIDDGAIAEPTDGIDVAVSDTLTVKGIGEYDGVGTGLVFGGTSFEVLSNGTFSADLISFNRGGGGTSTARGEVFSNVTVTNSTIVSLEQEFIINGKLTINNDDELVLNGGQLTLNDDFQNIGTFTANGNRVKFSGEGAATEDGDNVQDIDGVLTFEPVEIDGTNTDVVFSPSTDFASVTNLVVDPGSDDSNVQLSLSRDLEVGGNLTVNPGGSIDFTEEASGDLLRFKFGGPQTITAVGGLTIDRVEVDNGSTEGVKLSNGTDLAVTEEIRLTEGILDATNGTLTLRSTESRVASVTYTDATNDGTLDGTIKGSVRVQRRLTAGQEWYMIGSPAIASPTPQVTLDSLLQVQGTDGNDLWTQGFPGTDGPNADPSTANVRFYDETVDGDEDNGFVVPSDMNNQVSPGDGIIVFAFGDDDRNGTVESDETFPKLLDTYIEPTFDKSFTFSSVDATDDAGDGNSTIDSKEGWNLLTNPYLTTIDWDDGFSKTEVLNTVYAYDPINERYFTWNGSTGDLTEGYIAPNQAFFVKATSTSPSLEISDITTAQIDTAAAGFFRKSTEPKPPAVELSVDLSGETDNAYVSFMEGGEAGFDSRDAYQIRNFKRETTPAVQLHSLVKDTVGIQTSNLPRDPSEEIRIPLVVEARGCEGSAQFAGTATLTWPTLRNIPASWDVAIRDKEEGTTVNLKTDVDGEYSFDLQSSTDCNALLSTKSATTTSLPVPPSPEPVTINKSGAKSTSSPRFEFVVQPNTVIPVEFAKFVGTAEDNAAKLEWTTATEQNNAGFQVQRKVDGSFQNIDGAFVEGAGTSEEPQSYSYRVEDLDAGQHTFRLKQVDVDGGSSFSKETTVKVGLDSQYELKAYPNPISEQATIKFAVKESQDVTLELYNTLGQRVQVLHQGAVPSSQTRTVSLQASDLSSGLYIVRMRGESFSTTKSVTVVR
jgi:hypothetical protein